MKNFNFRAWLRRNGITGQDYSKLTGLSANTIYRRSAGAQGCSTPREVELLLRALESRGDVKARLNKAALKKRSES